MYLQGGGSIRFAAGFVAGVLLPAAPPVSALLQRAVSRLLA